MTSSLLEAIIGQKIKSISAISGGDINNAHFVVLSDGSRLFVKSNAYHNGLDMFKKEAVGLNYLNENSDFQIPQVHHCLSLEDQHFLCMDYMEPSKSDSKQLEKFGQNLATLHQVTHHSWGFESDNYIGRLEQVNQWEQSWQDFYINHRLSKQIELGITNNMFTSKQLNQLDRLRLVWESLIPPATPSLLHGDLWNGNYIATSTGDMTVIDPAIYYGHREVDIAMTLLFGGFPEAFYSAYNEVYPIEEDFDSRVSLYQLYPILVHANLFGGQYISQAISILNSYA